MTRQGTSRFRHTGLLALLVGIALLPFGCGRKAAAPPIRVGILHSLSGTMAISETAVVDATKLAIEEINASGGLLGRPVEAVVADGASDPDAFAREAARLIDDEKVCVVFGCWTSASRKAVKPVFEERNHLLFYPVQYEGIEQSPNIIYTGATPNQQVMPAVSYALRHFGKRVFLVGSDYVFPRMANAIIVDQVRALGGEVVGESYVPLGGKSVAPIIEQIRQAKPDVILNTINGDSNAAFFQGLREAGITPGDIPTISFSIGETELRQMDIATLAGDYAAWNYFQTVETPQNEAFVRAFRERYGGDRVTSDPVEAAYFGVKLWAQAVREAGTTDPATVRKVLGGEGLLAPEGVVYIDNETQHAWKFARLGKILPDGQFEIVWSTEKPVRPIPYPAFRSRAEWERMLMDLHAAWGGKWVNPNREEEQP